MTKGFFPHIEGLLILLVLTGLFVSPLPLSKAVTAESIAHSDSGSPATDYARMPMLFEQNNGQTDHDVRFISRAKGYTLYLTESEAVFSLKIASGDSTDLDGLSKFERKEMRSETLKMRFAGANEYPGLVGSDEAITRTNYYIGKSRIENITNYRRVAYNNIYDGIDAVFYGNHKDQLEYDFIVSPNADPSVISLDFEGARDISVNDRGELVLRTQSTELVQQKPVAYQEIDGIRKNVPVSYQLDDKRQVGFTIGDYDRSAELIIDPALSYLTYIGGTAFDSVFEVAADASGNAYISGTTSSLDFHGETRADNDGTGAFVAKINPQGSAFVYITILEGNGDDRGRGIAVDANNNAYVTGIASHFFPTTSGAYDTTHGTLNNDDVFITKLNATGGIVYSSFLGGTDEDEGFDVAVDSGGKAYVAGFTYSNIAFPSKNKYQGCGFVFPTSLDSQDAFLTVMNASGSDITYSTCIGGSVTHDQAFSIALDSSNNAYLTGIAQGGNFPTKNAEQPESGGGNDGWVAKFNPSSSGDASLIYSTYLGGSGTDISRGIAVSSGGTASVTGITGSLNFPLLNAFDSTNQINEAFVTQYSSVGSMTNSSFLGGADQDEGNNIAIGNGGTIYVTGSTLSNNFPLAVPFQSVRRGVRDAFVAKIRFGANVSPGVSSASYLGGNGNDIGNGIAVKGNFIFVVGETQSTNLLTTAEVIKQTSTANASNPDGFVARILDSRKDTIGTFDPIDTSFDLKNTLAGGAPDIVVNRGIAGDVGVAGDFNGDGVDTASTFNNGVWKITNFNVTGGGYQTGATTVNFGQAGDLPIVGDWNNDGIDTPGVYRPSVGQFFLTNSITLNAPVDVTVVFGVGEDLPVAGDWNADGFDSVGVFRPSVGLFFLTDDNVLAPNIDQTIFFGTNGDLPTAGDWDGNGVDTVGVWRTSTTEFFLSNDNINISNQFAFGGIGDTPVAGDWDGKPNQ